MDETLLSAREYAKKHEIPLKTVYNHIKSGKLSVRVSTEKRYKVVDNSQKQQISPIKEA